MTSIIFILLFISACFGITVSLFLRIRLDIDFLLKEKEKNIDLVKNLMIRVVTHQEMTNYVENIKKECEALIKLKQDNPKNKWKKFEQAFGGKKEEDD